MPRPLRWTRRIYERAIAPQINTRIFRRHGPTSRAAQPLEDAQTPRKRACSCTTRGHEPVSTKAGLP